MKLADLIAAVDETRPNQYDKYIKTQWVNEIEANVVEQVINRAKWNDVEFTPYNYDIDAEKELLIPEQFANVYVYFLYAKIDFTQNEIERNNNDVIMYKTAWNEYASWYRRHHRPKAVVR